MNSSQTSTTPFPASERHVFWFWGSALRHSVSRGSLSSSSVSRAVLVVLMVAAMLLGLPPAAPTATLASMAPPDDLLADEWNRPTPGEVVEAYAAPPAPWAAGHRGTDIAVPTGGEILSPADGVISFSGVVVDREVLSIDHGSGYVSSFEPVESELKVGDAVNTNDVVASLSTYNNGATHCNQPCLHWGVRLHGEYINPLLLTGELEPSALLPLQDQ